MLSLALLMLRFWSGIFITMYQPVFCKEKIYTIYISFGLQYIKLNNEVFPNKHNCSYVVSEQEGLVCI